MKNIIEKSHRLNKENYIGFVCATFTLCIKDKKIVFNRNDIVDKFIEILKNSCEKYEVKNWIYTFMPNHTHFILEGIHEKSDLWKCVVLFKQQTGDWFSKTMKNASWQKDFYDHIHKKDEDLINHIRYVAENPVRCGIVDSWEKYPYTGALNYKPEELL